MELAQTMVTWQRRPRELLQEAPLLKEFTFESLACHVWYFS
jgi:hypothetical protein